MAAVMVTRVHKKNWKAHPSWIRWIISLHKMNNPGRKQCVQEIRPKLMSAQLIIVQKTSTQEKDTSDFMKILQKSWQLKVSKTELCILREQKSYKKTWMSLYAIWKHSKTRDTYRNVYYCADIFCLSSASLICIRHKIWQNYNKCISFFLRV